jgi:hypothetical protein
MMQNFARAEAVQLFSVPLMVAVTATGSPNPEAVAASALVHDTLIRPSGVESIVSASVVTELGDVGRVRAGLMVRVAEVAVIAVTVTVNRPDGSLHGVFRRNPNEFQPGDPHGISPGVMSQSQVDEPRSEFCPAALNSNSFVGETVKWTPDFGDEFSLNARNWSQ